MPGNYATNHKGMVYGSKLQSSARTKAKCRHVFPICAPQAMIGTMKYERPFISVHLAYPRMLNATDGGAHFFKPRVVIGVTALMLTILVFAERLLTRVSRTVSLPRVGALWILPFAVLLGGIALMPGLFPQWWRKWYGWYCLGLSILAAAWYLRCYGGGAMAGLSTSVALYTDFIVLLGTLFIIASGIVVRVDQSASPGINVLVLLLAALMANILGSMGASVLLARPFFRMNRDHIQAFHVVFFVVIVANVGAALTSLGDPPLLLGFLIGVPFWWITIHAWPVWLLTMGLLLPMFYILDRHHRRKLPSVSPRIGAQSSSAVISINGGEQLLLLFTALLALFLAAPWRDGIMIAASAISLLICPAELRRENRFNFKPIREIGILFLAIFVTMTPVLNLLSARGRSGDLKYWLSSPGKCFFTAGAMSSVLDNAPTYLAILQARLAQRPDTVATPRPPQIKRPGSGRVAADKAHATAGSPALLRDRLADPGTALDVMAISLGAVFFGGLTWIGNGPNLMIRAIAQQEGIACPGFIRYVVHYALPILMPLLLVVWLIFFWR